MRRVMLQMGIVAAVALLAACGQDGITTPNSPETIVGSGVIVSQARPVSGFTAVTVTGPLRLIVQQAGGPSLEVTADDNVLRVVQSEVRDGRLYLGFAPNLSLSRIRTVVCRVTMTEVRDIDASGAAAVEMSDLAGARLGIRLTGAATGSGSGTAEELALVVSGASRWTAGDLRSRVVTAGVSGASYALVRVSHSLIADVNGASMLEYMGDPQVAATVDGVSVLRRVGP